MFGDGLSLARRDPIRSECLRLCDRLREFARTPDFEKLIDPKLAPSARAAMEAYARKLLMRDARPGIVKIARGSVSRDLPGQRAHAAPVPRPTPSTFKGLTAPTTDIYLGLRIDAQHIIEQRAFGKFKKDWALLGWASEADMPAIPVMHQVAHTLAQESHGARGCAAAR